MIDTEIIKQEIRGIIEEYKVNYKNLNIYRFITNMTNKECRFSYSDLDDSLIISCKEEDENVKERFSLGNFIFSLTGRGKIVGVQILNVSEVLPEYNINPNILSELRNVSLIVAQKNKCLVIALVLSFKNQEAKISIPLINLTPNIH